MAGDRAGSEPRTGWEGSRFGGGQSRRGDARPDRFADAGRERPEGGWRGRGGDERGNPSRFAQGRPGQPRVGPGRGGPGPGTGWRGRRDEGRPPARDGEASPGSMTAGRSWRSPAAGRSGGGRTTFVRTPVGVNRSPRTPSSPPPELLESAVQGGDREPSGAFAAAAPSDLIWGRHSAQAVLESGRPIHRIWCTPEMRFSARFLQLLREAKASGVLVEEVTWARLGQISGGAVHQGIVLQPAAAETLDLASLIEGCAALGEAPLLLAVDGLTDPQNLGAIVRSAEALGAHGMVVPQRRNAGLTGAVAKVAAGALEHLPIARVVNLNRSLDTLKQEGYRVIGLAGDGTTSLEEADLEGPLVIVTGSEGDGLSLLTRRTCDQLVRIPLRGSTPSLNASVATALLLYEVARRSWMRGLNGTAPAPRIVRPALPSPPPAAEALPEASGAFVPESAADTAADTADDTADDNGYDTADDAVSVSAGDSAVAVFDAAEAAEAAFEPAIASVSGTELAPSAQEASPSTGVESSSGLEHSPPASEQETWTRPTSTPAEPVLPSPAAFDGDISL